MDKLKIDVLIKYLGPINDSLNGSRTASYE